MFLSLARKNGRQNLVDGETLQKIRYSTIGSSLGVIKITEPKILKEFGRSLGFTEGCIRNALKNMD